MTGAQRVLHPRESVPDAKNRYALAIMTKAPRAGRVKTRLTPPLTAEEAAELNICFLRDISAAIARAGDHATGIACYTPAGSEEVYREILPAEFQLIAQRNGDFGQRLAGAIEDLLVVGFAAVCLINSDSPTVPASVFAQAADLLSSPDKEIWLGPSDDGGYYLIGMKKLYPEFFQGIDWSTDRVLGQTLECAAHTGLEVHLLPASYDVDDHTTLHRLCDDLLGPNESENSEIAPATREFLRQIVAREGRRRIWPAASVLSA